MKSDKEYSPLVGRIYGPGEKHEWDWVDFFGNALGVLVLGIIGFSLWLVGLWVVVSLLLAVFNA